MRETWLIINRFVLESLRWLYLIACLIKFELVLLHSLNTVGLLDLLKRCDMQQ